MSSQSSWVLTIRGTTYVYTRGEVVYLYGRWEYVRRLAGLREDAAPFAVKYVSPFRSYEDYSLWCKQQAANRRREMPCPNGCGGTWHYPAAERDRVVEEPGDPDRPDHVRGQADEADEIGAGFIQAALRGWGWDADDQGRWHREEP